MRLYYLLLALALVGCTPSDPTASIRPAQIEYVVAGYGVSEFRLMDGTRCVKSGSALTCEWQRPAVLVPRVE